MLNYIIRQVFAFKILTKRHLLWNLAINETEIGDIFSVSHFSTEYMFAGRVYIILSDLWMYCQLFFADDGQHL